MDLGLTGRAFLVTGGSKGVGRAVTETLLAEGARVTAMARGEDALLRMRRDQPEPSRERLLVLPGDILDRARCADVVARAVAWAGRLDGVAAVAGTGITGGPLTTDDTAWRAQFDVKVVGLLNVVRPAVDVLATSDAARIVVVNGVTARAPDPGMAAVSATRAAVANLARTLAVDLADRRIAVNTVNLGAILTDRQRARYAAADTPLTFDEWCAAEVARRGILLGRLGTPQDVAPLVAFLLSPLAGYLTGTSVDVSGGSGGYL